MAQIKKIDTVKDLMSALGYLCVNLNSNIYLIGSKGTKTYKINSVLFQEDIESKALGTVYLSFGKEPIKLKEKKE